MIKDINNKQYQHCYSLGKIDNSLLKKYNIKIPLYDFKMYCKNRMFPYQVIITGNKYNSYQQKHTMIFNLLEISNSLR